LFNQRNRGQIFHARGENNGKITLDFGFGWRLWCVGLVVISGYLAKLLG